jgi:hypothetical protein
MRKGTNLTPMNVATAILLLAALCLVPVSPAVAGNGTSAKAMAHTLKPKPVKPASKKKPLPLAEAKSALVEFRSSPFPYDGMIPEKDVPFLNVNEGGRLGHQAPRGGLYWQDETYSDRRALLYMPAGFDINKPALMVVFFHGNDASLMRDVVERQQVPRQLAEAGLNAVLLAPQFAVDARDSSAGKFWQPGGFARFLDEANGHFAKLFGDERKKSAFARIPVVLVAYSGGYHPAAYALKLGGAGERIRGVVLLDALYGEGDKFADWITARHSHAFFISAYSDSSRAGNGELMDLLAAKHIKFETAKPAKLGRTGVTFLDAGPGIVHVDFLSHAWADRPLQWVLARISGFPRPRPPG